MRTKQADRKPGGYENCVVVERQGLKPNAKANVRARNLYEKGKVFEKIPIFRGYILREIKPVIN